MDAAEQVMRGRTAPRAGYAAPALEKGLDILELLAEAAEPLSTRELAVRLGRSKAEIFRMVFVLVERGYLERDAEDRLVLTNRLFALGMRTPRPRQLAEIAIPVMERLSQETGQSAHLVVLNRGETVVIATTTGGADISFALRLGYRRPALEATSGLLVIAFQPPGIQRRLIDECIAHAGKPVDEAALQATLAAIKAKGARVSESRDVVGVTDIGIPVLGPDGRAVASIVVPHLRRHGTAAPVDAILRALEAAGAAISAALL
jgi:DNA-binding IclR family transcriptional regulator